MSNPRLNYKFYLCCPHLVDSTTGVIKLWFDLILKINAENGWKLFDYWRFLSDRKFTWTCISSWQGTVPWSSKLQTRGPAQTGLSLKRSQLVFPVPFTDTTEYNNSLSLTNGKEEKRISLRTVWIYDSNIEASWRQTWSHTNNKRWNAHSIGVLKMWLSPNTPALLSQVQLLCYCY